MNYRIYSMGGPSQMEGPPVFGRKYIFFFQFRNLLTPLKIWS